ncbi:CBS domain-containing protein [Streptomyces jietaisiensis]|uniref:CBS domain-containing protein n=1 Tax=Streptomyces griseoaurantiacus TaxID=68213 RepID=UPI002E2F5556|nr:CBS domain-containing protein [Streptomyces jietaisiensis]
MRGPHTVSDVMTHTTVAVGRDAPFKDIVTLMQEWKVSALPVLEGEGRVVGVVSEADLLLKEEFRDSDPDRLTQLRRLPDLAKAGALTAADVMTAPAVTVHPGATLGEAARIMARRRVKRLPVVNAEGLLEGVVSRADLLKVFLRTDEELAEEVRRDVVEPLLPAFRGKVGVRVSNGVVTLTGRVVNTSVVPLATRMARTVEGVVDVEWNLADETTAVGV